MNKYSKEILEVFYSKIQIPEDKTQCWIWIGSVNSYNTPHFWYKNEEFRACKYIYEYYNGQILDNKFVRHTCKNSKCVNPDHLYLRDDINKIIERFWSKVNVPKDWEEKDQCWEWTGGCETGGYGIFIANGEHIKAHRFSYELYNKPILDDSLILHSCDNPPCVNPNHLSKGTYLDNNQDRERKGRGNQLKGEQHPNSVLTEQDVIQIKIDLQNKIPERTIAKKYGVGRTLINKIKHNIVWKNV